MTLVITHEILLSSRDRIELSPNEQLLVILTTDGAGLRMGDSSG
jgi:hypothetical protein